MAHFIVLDSSPLWLACKSPSDSDVIKIGTWFTVWIFEGARILVPEIADYEVRRKLLYDENEAALERLDSLCRRLEFVPIREPAMREAARLWAELKRHGLPTDGDRSINADVILAAQAIQHIGHGDELIIATDNEKHLGRLVKTCDWRLYWPYQIEEP